MKFDMWSLRSCYIGNADGSRKIGILPSVYGRVDSYECLPRSKGKLSIRHASLGSTPVYARCTGRLPQSELSQLIAPSHRSGVKSSAGTRSNASQIAASAAAPRGPEVGPIPKQDMWSARYGCEPPFISVTGPDGEPSRIDSLCGDPTRDPRKGKSGVDCRERSLGALFRCRPMQTQCSLGSASIMCG